MFLYHYPGPISIKIVKCHLLFATLSATLTSTSSVQGGILKGNQEHQGNSSSGLC